MTDLEAQIAAEKKAIDEAPVVPIKSGLIGRCSWCGRVSENLVYVDTVHGQERYKGRDCCGGRHG
jgi:hypothetical protein